MKRVISFTFVVIFLACLAYGQRPAQTTVDATTPPAAPRPAYVQTLPIRGVIDEPSSPLGCAMMDDNTTNVGGGLTPRDWEISSLDSRYALYQSMGLNVLFVPLLDEDDPTTSWAGCGFSADPLHRPTRARAVAQEIILSVAAKHNLRVVFEITFSWYRRGTISGPGVGDNFGGATPTGGLFDFVYAQMDPNAYYGTQYTTGLSRIGLTDHAVAASSDWGNFYSDHRIYGWMFLGEVDPPVSPRSQDPALLARYWSWFSSIVHMDGQKTLIYARADLSMVNTTGCPPEPTLSCAQAGIDQLKSDFVTYRLPYPDILGGQFYAWDDTALAAMPSEVYLLEYYLRSDEGWTPAATGLLEGGSLLYSDSHFDYFYEYTPLFLSMYGGSAISPWYSDDFSGLHKNSSQMPDGGCGWSDNHDWNLITYTVTAAYAPCVTYYPPTYSIPSVGVHNGPNTNPIYPTSTLPMQPALRNYSGYTEAGNDFRLGLTLH